MPAEWLADVRAATSDTLLVLADHLPSEAAEALLELATGGKPRVTARTAAANDPFAARRSAAIPRDGQHRGAGPGTRFPLGQVDRFPASEQRQWVERDYAGPARISGSAGTGKTIVALHRAVHLARQNPDARVLLATFSEALAAALQTRLNRLVSREPKLAERIDVHSLSAIGERLYKLHIGPVQRADRQSVAALLRTASDAVEGHEFSQQFLLAEWIDVVDAWQLDSWEAYRDVARLGRKTRLSEPQRQVLWSILSRCGASCKQPSV